MHELAIMENILAIVVNSARNKNAKEIRRINLSAGVFSSIVPKYASQFFKMIARGTIAEHASLEFDMLPARFICGDCGTETQYEDVTGDFKCGKCGGANLRLVSGRELRIQSIEIV